MGEKCLFLFTLLTLSVYYKIFGPSYHLHNQKAFLELSWNFDILKPDKVFKILLSYQFTSTSHSNVFFSLLKQTDGKPDKTHLEHCQDTQTTVQVIFHLSSLEPESLSPQCILSLHRQLFLFVNGCPKKTLKEILSSFIQTI